MTERNLNHMRQPLVTATGILLGFTLNIAANWTPNAFTTNRISEYVIALSLGFHIPLSIVVLYRILNLNPPQNNLERYYNKTLAIFIVSISVYFLSIIIIVVDSFLNNR